MAWKTLYRKLLFEVNMLSSVSDARTLLNMTNHLMNNSAEQQENFFKIMEDIIGGGQMSDNIGVQIPMNDKEAYAILLDGKFGIFANLPHEDVFTIGPHACISLIGLFKQISAHCTPINYTNEPGSTRS